MRTLAFVLPLGLLAIAACIPAPDQPMPAAVPAAKTVLAIHGGAGTMSEAEMKAAGLTRADYEAALAKALSAGYRTLTAKGKTSVDAVEAAIRELEDCDLFNAGKGAVFTSDGRVELDASIMEGNVEGRGDGKRDPRKRAGAVAGVTHVRNPISAARAVMEMEGSQHVLLMGDAAEQYLFTDGVKAKFNLERVSNLYFWTDRRVKAIRDLHDKPPQKRGDAARPDHKFGTVGAVALGADGHLCAGTSTGGTTNKRPGRVGDSPIIGAGTYADDRACAVSCTGTGEVFIRHAVAHDLAARMLYGKLSLPDAATALFAELPDEADGGVGGLIALDRSGRHHFGMSAKLDGMYRGYVNEKSEIFVAIFAGDELKKIK